MSTQELVQSTISPLLSSPSTSVVAVSAVVSPVWLDTLRDTSEIAGLLLPLAGVTWLVIQIVTHFTRKK